MIVSSRSLYLGLACLLAATVVACDSNQAAPTGSPSPSPSPAPSPSPSPTPTPTPTPTPFTVTGTVAETAPTTDRYLDGVTVTANDRSVVTDGSGRFTIADLAGGTYTIRASKGGYSEGVTTVTLPADAGRVITFNLEPGLDRKTIERSGTISQDSSPCSGGSTPCARYDFPSHHVSEIEATLFWSSSDANMKLEVRCGGEVVATQTERSDNVFRSGEEYLVLELLTESRKGQMCEVRTLHLGGPAQNYTLVVSHGN